MKAPTAQLLAEHEFTLDPEPVGEPLRAGLAFKEEGNRMLKSGEYQQAVEQYDRALSIFSGRQAERANCLSNRAAALVRLRKLTEAEQSLREALEINPRHINARLRAARVFALQEEYVLAATEWSVIEQLRPLSSAELSEKDACNKKALDAGVGIMKTWGNKLLGKFGLSLDNFKVANNPDGSLNISLQQ